ncbi:hypothetical protein HC891_21360 [Candidatus Gracilibacteria bacterium]|nr:hypothetical protein [Candidatus Gracilibacteria bacterium]
MPDERNVERILEYLRSNADQYDLVVLRETLLAAGYSPIDLDEALTRFQGAVESVTHSVPRAEPSAQRAEPRTASPEPQAQNREQERRTEAHDPNAEVAEAVAGAPPAASSSGSVVDIEHEIQRCLAYFQRYQREFALPALRMQLLKAGQPQYVVEEALRRLQGPPAYRSSVDEAPPAAWPLGFLVLVGNSFLIGLSSIPWIITQGDAIWSIFFGPLLLLLEVVLGLAWRKGPRALFGRTLLYGALYSVLIVVLGGLAAVVLVVLIAFFFRGVFGA